MEGKLTMREDSYRISNAPEVFNKPFDWNEARARRVLEEVVAGKKEE
jgi:hypothetical protein